MGVLNRALGPSIFEDQGFIRLLVFEMFGMILKSFKPPTLPLKTMGALQEGFKVLKNYPKHFKYF